MDSAGLFEDFRHQDPRKPANSSKHLTNAIADAIAMRMLVAMALIWAYRCVVVVVVVVVFVAALSLVTLL